MSVRSEGLDSVSEQRRIPTNTTKMRKVSAVSVLIFIETPIYLKFRIKDKCLLKMKPKLTIE